jgi:hypothetical protein
MRMEALVIRPNGASKAFRLGVRTCESLAFAPVVDQKTKTLILDTLPSELSLSKGQYYANPPNDYWKLIGAALNQQLDGLTG